MNCQIILFTEKPMITTHIGKNISTIRKQSGLSQRDFAESLHVSPATVSKWEKGKSAPTHAHLETMCELYSVDANFIFEKNMEVNSEKLRIVMHDITEKLEPHEQLALAKEIIDQYLIQI